MDWKDALGSLRGALPQEPEENDTDMAKEPEENASSSEALPRPSGKLSVALEKKGRGGKTATIICGFSCSDAELTNLAKLLRKKIATGGSARGGEILLQGDCRQKAADCLRSLGWKI